MQEYSSSSRSATNGRPRAITGSAGSRIKLILGESGSDYLCIFDEDNGREFQSQEWTRTGYGSLPAGLAKQLINIRTKGRYVTDVAFRPSSEWCVRGRKRDGSGEYTWWGGTSASEQINKLACSGGRLQVSFGEDGAHVLVLGRNNYSCSRNLDSDLKARIKRIHDQ